MFDFKSNNNSLLFQFKENDIKSCQTLLIFQYQLSELCDLVMETPLYISSVGLFVRSFVCLLVFLFCFFLF